MTQYQRLFRSCISVAIMLLILLSHACTTPGSSSKHDVNEVTQTIKSLEYKALDAEFRLDTATISDLMDKNFIAIDKGQVSNKQAELSGIYNNIYERLKAGHTVDSFYLDNFRVDLFDNTAIATFFTVTSGKKNGEAYTNKRTRFYDVWVKRDGAWKMVSMQATFL